MGFHVQPVILGGPTLTAYPVLIVSDWGSKIDVVGFCFLDLASNYQPPSSLVEWIEAGERPIYIGFGSLVSFIFGLAFLVFEYLSCIKHDLVFQFVNSFNDINNDLN